VFGWAALALIPVAAVAGVGPLVSPGGALTVAHLGLATVALAYVLFGRGLRGVGVAAAGTLTLAEPATAAVLGVLVVGERFGGTTLAGVGLVAAGLVALVGRPGQPAPGVRSLSPMLDEKLRRLATEGKNFAAVTTLMPDGTALTHPMWVDADEDHLLLNTEVHRQKFRNMERDPRVTVTIWNAADPYEYAELRGVVVDTVRGPEARSHIDQLSQKYNGTDYGNPIQSERVIVKVAPK
jgi:PPOX class probable F420-dependent enzyme